MTRRSIGIAVAQMGPVHLADSRTTVVKRLLEMMREAKARQADMVVFPELALTTFFPRYWMERKKTQEKFFEAEMPNKAVQPLFDEAQKLGIGFYLGYAELTPEGQAFNTAIFVDKSANIVGKYRKIHLPGHSEHLPDAPFQHLEKKYFNIGDRGFGVWDSMNVRLGMCICNDRRWPETYRSMALQGAELVVLGYNTPSKNIHWDEPTHLRTSTHLLSLQGNAYMNGMWVAASGKSGSEDGFHMIGSSVIVAPTGEIVARTLGEEDEVIFTRADLDLGTQFRKYVFNFEKHRSPEHYHLITQRKGAGEPLPQPIED
jgi:predicted amidohydrolase